MFASVVDDPSAHPDRFPTEEAQRAERERLFGIIRRMMQKQLHKHPEVYEEARAEMLKHCDGQLPPVFDPFAGGGSIPLEALRLGFETHAGDLNPVAVLLNKCNLELAPRWVDHPPVNPKDRERAGGADGWKGTAGLAADVRYYGRLILEEARKRIGHLYPPVKVTAEMATDRPDLEPYVGKELPVIAWIWARTIRSPNPAAQGTHVPLMSTFWLSNRKGKEVYLHPTPDSRSSTWSFRVRYGKPDDPAVVRAGTKLGRGARFRCLLTGDPFEDEYIKYEGLAGRFGAAMVAIVADGRGKRIYFDASNSFLHELEPVTVESVSHRLARDPRNIWCAGYGLDSFDKLFTPRQLIALATLSDLVREIRPKVQDDASRAGMASPDAETYSQAVTTFLALAVDRCADFNNSLCGWSPSNEKVMHLFGLQAIPMVWDYAEANILGHSVGAWSTCCEYVAKCTEVLITGEEGSGHAYQIDAGALANDLTNILVSTDPPYYHNIGYAAISDFFYVWLRRTIGDLYPDLFSTLLVPKLPELTAAPERFNSSKEQAKEHFESGFRRAFTALRKRMDPRFPLTVYYAFKQDDETVGLDEETGNNDAPILNRTTGWETMLKALLDTGFQITATWPVRASQKWRMVSMGTNALASYIALACRPLPEDAPQTDRRSFIAEVKRELPAALRRLQQGNIAPVDFAQASIGPGMAIYSRYRSILEASGKPMTVRTALALINQTLSEVLAEQEDEFDADTRWAIAWYEQYGFTEGEYGEAELLSKAKVTSVNGLVVAGLVEAKGGKVRLLRPEEMSKDWDPEKDRRLTIWEMTHHLLRVYYHEEKGDTVAAQLLRWFGASADLARDLAYRLFDLSERKNRSAEAQAYNALVIGWPELARLARELPDEPGQTSMFTH